MSDARGSSVDVGLVDAYLSALRSAHDASNERLREGSEKRAASIWFAMDVATQHAATVEAARAGVLEPRIDRHGLKVYPTVRGDRVIWVTIPER